VIVHFVDIGGIGDNHCLNILFIVFAILREKIGHMPATSKIDAITLTAFCYSQRRVGILKDNAMP